MTGPSGDMRRWILQPLSALYGLGVKFHRLIQGNRPYRFEVPVISVGNITVGGTGKTEAVALICQQLRAMGLKPGILSRGYGRQGNQSAVVVTRGRGLEVPVRIAGDEPALLAKRLYDVAVVVGKDRVKTGRQAIRDLGCNVLVLDDGFQRRHRVFRDLDVVLIDAGDPFGNHALLPAGRLREPVSSLVEADVLIITRADQYPLKPVFAQLEKTVPDKQLMTACHTAKQLVRVQDGTRQSLDYLTERQVMAVSGIARPLSFEKSLVDAGACIKDAVRFGDHHWFSKYDMDLLAEKAKRLEADIVTTSKDAVRMDLDERFEKIPVWAMEIEMEILSPKDGLRVLIESTLANQRMAKKG